MGLVVSTPPSERTVADLMLPSVVGTEAATPCSQKEPDEPIYKACFPSPGTRRGHKCLTGFIAFRVPATGPRRADAFGPARNPFLLLRGSCLLAPTWWP